MKRLSQKDLSKRAFFLVCALAAVIKLFLASRQLVFITPLMAPIDDTLMYDSAVQIANGAWLGSYNWLTLSKYMLFSVWLAGLHTLHVPYLLAGQLLYLAACAAAVAAFAPVVRRNVTRAALFAFLLFSPVQSAAAVQLRVYRDNITSALALLLFAGFAGAALRHRGRLRHMVGYLLLGGAGLAGSVLNREDGVWYLVFCLAATAVTCAFVLSNKGVPKKLLCCAVQLVPYAVLGAGMLAFCLLNLRYYGRFVLSDFTSREYKDACGALMRVQSDTELARTPVTREVRAKLYYLVPEFTAIQEKLESHDILNDFGNPDTGEYTGGGFYWALRCAVYESGFADTAAEAQQYYTVLAQRINALVDSGELPGKNRISATVKPVEVRDILPTLGEGAANLGRMLVGAEADPAFAEMSVCTPELEQEYEGFLREEVSSSAKPYTAEAYYTPAQERAYFVLRAVRWLYAVVVCAGFAAALFAQAAGACSLVRSVRTKTPWSGLLVWLIQLGLLLAVVLRCCMVGYLFVVSFNPWVGRIMYLCGAYPALLLYCFVGSMQAARLVRARRERKQTTSTRGLEPDGPVPRGA